MLHIITRTCDKASIQSKRIVNKTECALRCVNSILKNMENCKNSRTTQLASTFQFVYNSVLGNITNSPIFVESGWEAKIVMFPSKLLHIVYTFQTSDDYRISIAGNLH